MIFFAFLFLLQLQLTQVLAEEVANPIMFKDVLTNFSFKKNELGFQFNNLYLNLNLIFTVTYTGDQAIPEIMFIGKKALKIKDEVDYLIKTSKQNGDDFISCEELKLKENLDGFRLVFKSNDPDEILKYIVKLQKHPYPPGARAKNYFTQTEFPEYFQKYILVMKGKNLLSSFFWDQTKDKRELEEKIMELLITKQNESN